MLDVCFIGYLIKTMVGISSPIWPRCIAWDVNTEFNINNGWITRATNTIKVIKTDFLTQQTVFPRPRSFQTICQSVIVQQKQLVARII